MVRIQYPVTVFKKGKWVDEIWTHEHEDPFTFINTEFDSDMSKMQSKVASYVGSLEIGTHKMKIEKLNIINNLMHLVEWYGIRKQFEIDFDNLTLNVFKRIEPNQYKLF